MSGRNKIPMAELRRVCTNLGWQDVQTFIQSGNVLLRAKEESRELEVLVQTAIQENFKLTIPVVVRSAKQWECYLETSPFKDQSKKDPNLVLLVLAKESFPSSVVQKIRKFATRDESIQLVRDGLWIHFKNGVGKSKISPSVLDRAAGSPVTARNWRTVCAIQELARGLTME